MKRVVYSIAVLIVVAICVWLVLRRPAEMPKQNTVLSHPTTQPTNVAIAPIISNAPPQPTTNTFVRPDSIDESTWATIMQDRQVILSEDQPVEFYARVVDQDGQPVEGAKLTISLERLDETMFAPTNYLHWDPGAAYQKKYCDLLSDSNGWIQLTYVTGRSLRIETLVKDGYSWVTPQIGSFGYEPDGKHSVGYAGMEDAFDPSKGYILHLQKIDEANSTNMSR